MEYSHGTILIPLSPSSLCFTHEPYASHWLRLNILSDYSIRRASEKQWKTHRKIVQTSLNERCNAIVWTEAASLGDQMARHRASQGTFTSVGEDVRTVSLNILCKAYFGQSYEFQGQTEGAPASPSASFRSSPLSISSIKLLRLFNPCILNIFSPKISCPYSFTLWLAYCKYGAF